MSSEHLTLADSIRKVHQDLRRDVHQSICFSHMNITYECFSLSLLAPEAVESIWNAHVANFDKLNEYAQSMRQLAEHHWADKVHGQTRLTWCYQTIKDYFHGKDISGLQRRRARDQRKQITHEICSDCQIRIEYNASYDVRLYWRVVILF